MRAMPIILARFNSGYNQATKSERVMKVINEGEARLARGNVGQLTSIQRLMWMRCPGHAGVKGTESRELTERTDWWAKQTPKWLASRKICRTQELVTLHAAKKLFDLNMPLQCYQ